MGEFETHIDTLAQCCWVETGMVSRGRESSSELIMTCVGLVDKMVREKGVGLRTSQVVA